MTVTFDLGLLTYAEAVPLPEGVWRYCAMCSATFLPRRVDQTYCSRVCKCRFINRMQRATQVHPRKRGRPRKALAASPVSWQSVLGRARP